MKLKLLYLLLVSGMVLTILLSNACQEPEPPLQAPEVNPAFEQFPPIADEVFVQKLEDSRAGNILLTARFPDQERRRIGKDPFLTITDGEEKFVLRDDGKAGDAKAGDGLFSIILQEDLERMAAIIDRADRVIRETQGRPFQEFQLRRQVSGRRFEPIGRESFLTGKLIKITDLFKLLGIPDPKLKDHSLMITDVNVVEDPTRTIPNPCMAVAGDENKPWTFARLMTEMANTPATGVSVSDFTLQWLETWLSDQVVNSQTVNERRTMEDLIINPWKTRSNFSTTGQLDMKFAPFKLIAIVNRLDLRGNSGYGSADAGEGRFIFCPVDDACNPVTSFTIIFEYGVNIKGCAAVKAYAQQWHDLKDLTVGSAAYNTALQAITDQFTLANTSPSKPNGSSLNQLRTNEIVLDSPWELREFVLCDLSDPMLSGCTSNHLTMTTVKMEPDKRFNRLSGATAGDRKILADWANANTLAIQTNNYEVPLTVGTEPFLAAHSQPLNPGHFWDADATPGPGFITDDDARHMLSLNTCAGCHAGETNTFFTHVTPAGAIGAPASLSGFLTGIAVTDPANRPTGSPTVRNFDDLQRRAQDLDALVNRPCLRILVLAEALRFKPIFMTH